MAEKAAGMAWVLVPPKPEDPSQMAEPSERGNPNVSQIVWVSNKGHAVQSVLWTREGESLFLGQSTRHNKSQ